jgi:hypothetical protein
MWWLTPIYGIVGAAWGMVIAGSLVNVTRLVLVGRLLHVNPLSLAMLKPLVAGGLASGAIYGLATALQVSGEEQLYWLVPVLIAFSLLSVAIYATALGVIGIEASDREVGRVLLQRLRAQFRLGSPGTGEK